MGNNNFFKDFTTTDKAGKKAAIYVRVSRNEYKLNKKDTRKKLIETGKTLEEIKQAGEKELRQSVKTQKEDGIRYCEQHDPAWAYELYDQDSELSGTLVAGTDAKNKKKTRPDLDRMLKDVAAGKIHTVIVRDIKRLARNARHLKEIIQDHLVPMGVVLHGTAQTLDITTPEGRAFVSMLAEFAELEVFNTRQSSMRGRDGAAQEGTLNLGANTYGYHNNPKTGDIEIVPAEAEIVKRVFNEYVNEKRSCKQIANRLNEELIRTKFYGIKSEKRNFTDSKWAEHQIWKMVQNPRYIGKIKFNDDECDSPFPPIIEPKLWEAAKTERGIRPNIRPKTQTNRHLMSGILKCGYCLDHYEEKRAKGWNITPTMILSSTVPGRRQYKAKKPRPTTSPIPLRHYYYACQSKTAKSAKYCRGVRVPKKKIEQFIEEFVGAFAEEQFSKAMINAPATVNLVELELKSLRSQLEKVTRKQVAISKKFMESENMNLDVLVKLDADCKRLIANLESQIRNYESQLSDISQEDARNAFGILKKWKALDMHTKRKALQLVMPKAVMFEDHLDMYLGSIHNAPARADYLPRTNRSKERFFPTVSEDWCFFLDEHRIVRVGAVIAEGGAGKLRAHVNEVRA